MLTGGRMIRVLNIRYCLLQDSNFSFNFQFHHQLYHLYHFDLFLFIDEKSKLKFSQMFQHYEELQQTFQGIIA